MSAIVIERSIAATPERVYAALTRQDDLAGWWTTDLGAVAEAGSVLEFRYNQGTAVRRFEVAELVAGERVRWLLRRGPAHWIATSITWHLTPAHDGTRLVFTQDGFAQEDALVAQTRFEWASTWTVCAPIWRRGEAPPTCVGSLPLCRAGVTCGCHQIGDEYVPVQPTALRLGDRSIVGGPQHRVQIGGAQRERAGEVRHELVVFARLVLSGVCLISSSM